MQHFTLPTSLRQRSSRTEESTLCARGQLCEQPLPSISCRGTLHYPTINCSHPYHYHHQLPAAATIIITTSSYCHHLPRNPANLPSSATICHHLPPPVSTCHQLLAPATTCHQLLAPATTCHHLPAPVTTHQGLMLAMVGHQRQVSP